MADREPPEPSVDEERLRRLLESPLDAPAGRTRPAPAAPAAPSRRPGADPPPPSWTPFLAAVLVGGALALGGYLLAGGDEPQAAPPTVATPPTAPAPPEHPFGALPDGYYALNQRVGARPERILVRDDAMFVSFTTAVRSTLDPDQTAGFTRGEWAAVLNDGRRVAAIGEFTDPFARGAFTLGFPVDGYAAEDVAAVELTGEALRTGLTHEAVVAIETGLPWSGVPTEARLPLEGGLVFVIDSMDLDTEGGRIDWHFEGAERLQGAATASLRFTAQGTFPAGVMHEANPATFLGVFGSAIPPRAAARAGTIELVADRVNRPSTIRTIHATWTIDWFALVPAAATIPLDAVPLATVG